MSRFIFLINLSFFFLTCNLPNLAVVPTIGVQASIEAVVQSTLGEIYTQEPLTTSTSTTPTPGATAQPSPTELPPSETSMPEAITIPADAYPCELIPLGQVEELLGEIVSNEGNENGFCKYETQSGENSLAVSIERGQKIKLFYLDIFAQLQDGCALSLGGGTHRTPTPLPLEIAALSSLSLVELVDMNVAGHEKFGSQVMLSPTTRRLGDGSYNSGFGVFEPTNQLRVISGDILAAFTQTRKTESIEIQKDALFEMMTGYWL